MPSQGSTYQQKHSGMTRTGRDPQGNGGEAKLGWGVDRKLMAKPQEKGKTKRCAPRAQVTLPGHQGLRPGPPGLVSHPHLAVMPVCKSVEPPLQEMPYYGQVNAVDQLWVMDVSS